MSQLDRQAMSPVNSYTMHSMLPPATKPPAMPEAEMFGLLQQVFDRLEHPGAVDGSSDEQLLSYLHSIMLDPIQFVAGNLTRHHAAWQMLFRTYGYTKRARHVLSWVADGIKFEFVSPFSPGQERHPRYRVRLQLVRQLLSNTVGPDAVHGMLHRDQPAHVQFANRISCSMHKQFVTDTIQDLIRVGSLVEWQGLQPPVVINGMGVVKNRKGKLRLILDCRYVNMFSMYAHFGYEKLSDVPQYLQLGDWFVLTDAKSGYHHVPMHESSWQYLAIEWQGRLLAYHVTPFGSARACRDFTWIMEAAYMPFKLRSFNMTFVIDDALMAAQTRAQCMFNVKTFVMLLTALGFYLSWDKCLCNVENFWD